MTEEADLQEAIEESEETEHTKYGTFAGVFTPTLLTILGVIMYLRTGWVVGNAGLGWSIVIILLAFVITGTTALSLSSITTNIRIGAGGAYSIISQSLGVEMGGAIGIPLYLSQTLAVAMYVFGFREGWLHIFEGHPAILVDLAAFAVILLIAYVSAGLAFRIQYFIMAIIAASLVSIGIAFAQNPMPHDITWFGSFPGTGVGGGDSTSFWAVFAVFFPATTGIMAGVNMSGDLKNPKRNIPTGTLFAVFIALIVYLVLAFWFATAAPVERLVSDFTLIVDLAWWGPAVLAGILGATFSSALASTVGAPRILQALGDHEILPAGDWLSRLSDSGEPRNALWITAVITAAALLLRDLNAIAPLITMFFMITYLMINAVVCIEQALGLVSFRPVFRVPRFVPMVGLLGCLFAMFIVNPTFSLVAIGFVIALYIYLLRVSLTAPYGDMRSGLFVSIAGWAVEKVSSLPASNERTWRPNLMVPVEQTEELLGTFRIIHDLSHPKGSVAVVGLTDEENRKHMHLQISNLREAFHQEDLFASSIVMTAGDYLTGIISAMESLSGTFFPPNVLFLNLPEEGISTERAEDIRKIVKKAGELEMGVALFGRHPKSGFGRRTNVNLWVPNKGPEWDLSLELGNLDLALLLSYKLKTSWNGQLKFNTAVQESDQLTAAREFMENLVEAARMPEPQTKVWFTEYEHAIERASGADMDVFPLPEEVDFDFCYRMIKTSRSSCLFVRDSGRENALA